MWGFFPLYWPLLEPAGAVEILAHRIVWSLVVVVGVVLVTRRGRSLRTTLADRRTRSLLAVAAVLITVNWGTYIWGQPPPRRGDVARLLHQPAGQRAPRRRGARRAAPDAAVGGAGHRDGGGAGTDRRVRAPALGRADPGVLVRQLRPGEEEGERRGGGEPGDRDHGGVPGGHRLRAVPCRHRRLDLRHPWAAARRPGRRDRAGHGAAAALLRRRGHPDPAEHARVDAVPHPHRAVRPRVGGLRRADAADALARLRVDLAGAGALHVRDAPQPAPDPGRGAGTGDRRRLTPRSDRVRVPSLP